MHSERFNNAINALVKGYFNNTLAKGTCKACAVGNICAAAIGDKVKKIGVSYVWEIGAPFWGLVFSTPAHGPQYIKPDFYVGPVKAEIDATGYTWQELARVELTFETATHIPHTKYYAHTPEEIDADQYAGLMAVVKVLCEIEGIEDSAPYEEMFAGKVLQGYK